MCGIIWLLSFVSPPFLYRYEKQLPRAHFIKRNLMQHWKVYSLFFIYIFFCIKKVFIFSHLSLCVWKLPPSQGIRNELTMNGWENREGWICIEKFFNKLYYCCIFADRLQMQFFQHIREFITYILCMCVCVCLLLQCSTFISFQKVYIYICLK